LHDRGSGRSIFAWSLPFSTRPTDWFDFITLGMAFSANGASCIRPEAFAT
jgi:hypothetical protein